GEGREVDATEPSPIQMWGVVIDAHVLAESRVTHVGSSLSLSTRSAPFPQLLAGVVEAAKTSGGFLPVMIEREGGHDLLVATPQGDLVPASDQTDSAGFEALKAGTQSVGESSGSEGIGVAVGAETGNGLVDQEGVAGVATPQGPLVVGANGVEGSAGVAEAGGGAVYPTRRELHREPFVTEDDTEEPASKGVRGAFAKVGIRLKPSAAERAERDDVGAVSQHWPGPRTIAIANPKGGVGKTPTTVALSAVFARYGGAGVLAGADHPTRGPPGWRTEQGPHEATLLDLLPQMPALLSTGAQSADLAHYVHHQTRDRFDVLRSKPTALANEQRLHPEDVDAIHSVASKYYRLVFIDSGNDESDPMWLR